MFTFRQALFSGLVKALILFVPIDLVLAWYMGSITTFSTPDIIGCLGMGLLMLVLARWLNRVWPSAWGDPFATPLTPQQEAYWRGTRQLSQAAFILVCLYIAAITALLIYLPPSSIPHPGGKAPNWSNVMFLIGATTIGVGIPMAAYEIAAGLTRRQVRRRHPAFMHVGRNNKLVNVRS